MQMSSKVRLVRKTSSNNKDAIFLHREIFVVITVIEDELERVGSKTYS